MKKGMTERLGRTCSKEGTNPRGATDHVGKSPSKIQRKGDKGKKGGGIRSGSLKQDRFRFSQGASELRIRSLKKAP